VPDTEQPERVAREVGRGRSERTPWLALGMVQLTIGVVVALVVLITLLVYFLA
jgi:hypothetical protein